MVGAVGSEHRHFVPPVELPRWLSFGSNDHRGISRPGDFGNADARTRSSPSARHTRYFPTASAELSMKYGSPLSLSDPVARPHSASHSFTRESASGTPAR